MTGKRYKHQTGKENSLKKSETESPALDFLSVIRDTVLDLT